MGDCLECQNSNGSFHWLRLRLRISSHSVNFTFRSALTLIIPARALSSFREYVNFFLSFRWKTWEETLKLQSRRRRVVFFCVWSFLLTFFFNFPLAIRQVVWSRVFFDKFPFNDPSFCFNLVKLKLVWIIEVFVCACMKCGKCNITKMFFLGKKLLIIWTSRELDARWRPTWHRRQTIEFQMFAQCESSIKAVEDYDYDNNPSALFRHLHHHWCGLFEKY